jgi:hypothetical protein
MESWIWRFECTSAHSNRHIQTFQREIPMSPFNRNMSLKLAKKFFDDIKESCVGRA